MLTAITVLLIIMAVIFTIFQEITRAWHGSVGKVESLQNARAAFVAMTHTISQATLNPYYDYVDTNAPFNGETRAQVIAGGGSLTAFTATGYARTSDLHFISGTTKNSGGTTTNTFLASVSQITYPTTHSIFFEAPMGSTGTSGYQQLNGMLNACGCYGPDPTVPSFLASPIVPTHYRYRLMQFTEPSEYLSVYASQTQGTVESTYNQWFLGPLTQELSAASSGGSLMSISQVAQNVVALVILPKLSAGDQAAHPTTILAPNYDYDSRNSANSTTYNQLPPVVEVTMVAIDEASALKMGNTTTPPNAQLGLTSSLFTQASNFQTDLNSLEAALVAAHLNFQVFQSEVALQGAKWSE
jgi:uncharacterized protein (TIGR02599 family)